MKRNSASADVAHFTYNDGLVYGFCAEKLSQKDRQTEPKCYQQCCNVAGAVIDRGSI